MAKVFTITQGLENMGAMKTGGQGSVYKGRRIGEIITAVKLLPTPIYNESNEDKNFRDFKNEVEKLKKVNEKPNPNVVKILSSGLSETGNFPFIEMEYIEGPDLEELLKPPHDPVFTIKEVIKVAEQLSNALAHCHSLDVKHGDVKSNNVKFNIQTGNYVLLDFGLAAMSDEQRRTSLRQAGAVEFMAPEQNEGQMLFQTDIYSFGIILFELLAGRVPFPLHDKGETARNNIRLAHIETLPPDVVALRKEALPSLWQQDVRAREMNIPEWLVTVIYKCLKKKPENRFANGIELHEHIFHNSIQAIDQKQTGQVNIVKEDIQKLVKEKEHLQLQVSQYKHQITAKEKEIEELKVFVNNKDQNHYQQKKNVETAFVTAKKGVSKTAFGVLIFLTIGLAAFSGYSILKNYTTVAQQSPGPNFSDTTASTNDMPVKEVEEKKDLPVKKEIQKKHVNNRNDSANKNNLPQIANETAGNDILKDSQQAKQEASEVPAKPKAAPQYMVISKAYFYNTPDESSRRNAFVVPSNNAIINALDEQNNFIYVVFTNQLGQSSKGWLRKKDLQPLNE
jgi:serine/threonine protein kinase